MKETACRFTRDELDTIKYDLPDPAVYSFRVIGIVGFDRHFGQRDQEFGWDYLCRNMQGKPVLIHEYYHLDWNAELARSDLCSVTAEELSPDEFERYRAECKTLPEEELALLPITLDLRENPYLTWIG